MVEVTGVGKSGGAILTRQRDLAVERGQGAVLEATDQARQSPAPLQSARGRGSQPVEGSPRAEQSSPVSSDQRTRNVTQEATLRENNATAEARINQVIAEPTQSTDQRISEILSNAADENRAAQSQRVSETNNNQPVADSEIGGTVNIRV